MRSFLAATALLSACAASAQFGVQEYLDITYTSGGGFPQKLDLFLPTPVTNSKRGAIMFVHGGGWSAGSKEDLKAWGQYYASKGYVAASINYRLTPTHVWPAQIDDTQAAMRFMRKYAAVLSLDPNKIAAMGASAGGHLVQFLALTDTFNDTEEALKGFSSRAQVVFNFVGPTDLTRRYEWRSDIWQLIEWLSYGMSQGNTKGIFRTGSPLFYANEGDYPIVSFYGIADDIVPISQGRRMRDRLQLVGLPHQYYEFAGEGHGFSWPTLEFCIGVMDQTLASMFGP